MPRNSSSGNDESPAPRRSSARIAACQVNKPASPSPAKKSTIKRKSKVAEEYILPSIDERKPEVNGFEGENVVLNSGDAHDPEPLEKKQRIDNPDEVSAKENCDSECRLTNDNVNTKEIEDAPIISDTVFKHVDENPIPINACLSPVVANEESVNRTSTENGILADLGLAKHDIAESPSSEIIEEKNSHVHAVECLQPIEVQDTSSQKTILPGDVNYIPQLENKIPGEELCTAEIRTDNEIDCPTIIEGRIPDFVSQDLEEAH